MKALATLSVTIFLLAGCSASLNTESKSMTPWELRIADDIAGVHFVFAGAYLHRASGWVTAIENGTTADLGGLGGEIVVAGKAPAGTYDRLRVLFQNVTFANRTSVLVENGVELVFELNVSKGANTSVSLGFAWADSLYESEGGLAFEPVVDRLVSVEADVEVLRLTASGITTGGTLAPVARMRLFDATGLEVFASTFAADSPEPRFISNAGIITLSATPSAAIQPGATLSSYRWDIDGTILEGSGGQFDTGIEGGNFTIRLTVKDSAGGQDSQTVRLAVKPGFDYRYSNFTGTITGGDQARLTQTSAVFDAAAPPKSHIFRVEETVDGQEWHLVNIAVALTTSLANGHDLNLRLINSTGATVVTATGAGSTHTINYPVPLSMARVGDWKAQVYALYGANVAYSVGVTLTWQHNREMAVYTATYEDGHSHQH